MPSSHSTSAIRVMDYNAIDSCKTIQQAQELKDPDIMLVYDGSLEGFFTCVYISFQRKITPRDITTESRLQASLFGDVEYIETSESLSTRVCRGLAGKLGADEFERIKMAMLSDDPKREISLLRYIQMAMRKGRYTYCDHSNPIVAEYERLWRRVSNERHSMLQFARFSELEGGIYFAKINPNANVVPIIMEHFSKRFNTQPFIIYDEVHGIAGVSKDGSWSLVETNGLTPPPQTEDEKMYRQMWRSFYDSICNRERINPALRRSFMPKRLWSNICEVADEIDSQS